MYLKIKVKLLKYCRCLAGGKKSTFTIEVKIESIFLRKGQSREKRRENVFTTSSFEFSVAYSERVCIRWR